MEQDSLVQAVADYLQEELAAAAPIGAVLRFAYPEGNGVLIDGSGKKNQVSLCDGPADCTVTLPLATHVQMLSFELDQGVAFRQGRMRIAGDIAVALRLAPLVSKPFRRAGEGEQ